MLDRILVTLDGSTFGEQALPFTKAVAAKTGASVNISHVQCCDPPTDLLQNTPFQYEGVNMTAYVEKHAEEQRAYLMRHEEAMKVELPDNRICSALLEGYVTEALERHEGGTLPMVFPTLSTINELSRFRRCEEVLAYYRAREIPAVLPRLVRTPTGVGLEVDPPED